jgi:hypothetical protein
MMTRSGSLSFTVWARGMDGDGIVFRLKIGVKQL